MKLEEARGLEQGAKVKYTDPETGETKTGYVITPPRLPKIQWEDGTVTKAGLWELDLAPNLDVVDDCGGRQ